MAIRTASVLILLSLMIGTPLSAQTGAPEKSSKEKVGDKATGTIKRTKIPAKLEAIKDKPYSLKGMNSCAAIQREIRELNEVLGADVNERVNKSKAKKREETAANVAGSAIGSIIPFRGLIREVSGAASAERKYNKAVYAGTVRRGFLKGIGHERGCKKPARP